MRPGMNDARVPIVRKRLNISGEETGTKYDELIAASIKKFQKDAGVNPDGLLGTSTLRALNEPSRSNRIDIILANMDRWRWLPRNLGEVYVMLNIPDFTLKVVSHGATVWTTNVVVGKPSTPTPILSATMKSITVNPTWNVPPSIVHNEYLPALRQDPQALERIGLRVTQNSDGSVHISQPPGERNALRRLRFNFPNKFLVYQHDTPDKYLFAHEKRAYSHGCMRVQDPVKYAEVLLSLVMPNAAYTQERIRKMFGSAGRDIQLSTPIPVHITYQTAYVDDGGKLVIREDIYGRDTEVLAALNGDQGRIAHLPLERPQPHSRPPTARLPNGYANASGNGPSFFERVFGGYTAIPRAPINKRGLFTR